jgi:transcriptional regulator with XRE-family HTH domain
MEPLEIKILLLRAGITQASIAKKIGVTLPFVNQIIKGQRSTGRVRRAIAKAVGKRVEELWPSGPFEKAA